MSKDGSENPIKSDAPGYNLAERIDRINSGVGDGQITKEEVQEYINTVNKIKALKAEQSTVQSVDINSFGRTVVTDRGGSANVAEYGPDFERKALTVNGSLDPREGMSVEELTKRQNILNTPMRMNSGEYLDAVKSAHVAEELLKIMDKHPGGMTVQEFAAEAAAEFKRDNVPAKAIDPNAKTAPTR
jgi:hypothetical protein